MRARRAAKMIAAAIASIVAIGGTSAAAAAAPAAAPDDHRVVAYYQTQVHDGAYVSPLPLLEQQTGLTDLIVAAIHLNEDPDALTLNDHAPSDARYAQMWQDVHAMQDAGVRALGMLGGAAPGTFERLDADFDTYYPALRDMVTTFGLDGLDLDVEEPMSLAGIVRLIDALRSDFGDDFVITLTPVAPALVGEGNLSGFDYGALEAQRGSDIDWYNAQFYCGWGTLATTDLYDRIAQRIEPSRVVAIALTDPSLCGGYVDPATLETTVGALADRYPDFGGIAGWEYYTAAPDGTVEPWRWFARMGDAIA